jgi:hypothetical protein
MSNAKELRPRRVVTAGERYTCKHCGLRTVHLMQMVQHGITVHGLTWGPTK